MNKNQMNKMLLRFLENSIIELDGFNKIEFIIKMITRLNYNYSLFNNPTIDENKIKDFINEYKILDKDDIIDFIKDNINNWKLEYLKEFINTIDLNANEFYYNKKDCNFISLADYYDNNSLKVDEDIKMLFGLLKDIM